MKNIIQEIVETKLQTEVFPKEFFVAWQGVMTLAYEGFSQPLLDIKKELKERIPGLRNENPGSLWPKTTLGALKDNRTLTWEDAYKLKEICSRQKIEPKPFEIKELSLVVFQCRSLEKRLSTVKIKLTDKNKNTTVPADHLELVNQTMKQFNMENLLNYLTDLKREGNRIADYKKDFIESTLVFDLSTSQTQHNYIDNFIEEINRELPDLYEWFSKDSRHMTVRAIV